MISKLYLSLVLPSVMLAGCASTPMRAPLPKWTETYFSQVRDKIEPIWSRRTSSEIKKLLASGLTIRQLTVPENTVKLVFDVEPSGKVENVQIIQESKYTFFNKIALNTIRDAGSMTPPPAECLKENRCKIRWDFILNTQ